MVQSLVYWCDLYKSLKNSSLCVDIETTRFNGPISLIGVYKPQDGRVDDNYTAFVKGKNLTTEELRKAFQGCKMLITFNGLKFDIPMIRKQFPGVIPEDVKVLDLYLFAKKLQLNTNLKVLENTLGVDRLREESKKRGQAIKLWNKYSKYQNEKALLDLIEYNKQDAVNLYPIVEDFVTRVYNRVKKEKGTMKDDYKEMIRAQIDLIKKS